MVSRKQYEEMKSKLKKEELELLKKNEELLQSQGILHDYDNKEILYPMNLWILSVLEKMNEFADENLKNSGSFNKP